MDNKNIIKPRLLTNSLPGINKNILVLITGARQTGKTTIVKDYYKNLRYINLDAPENRDAIRLIHSLSWGQSVGNAIIDEAQKEPVLFEKLKFAFDEKQISFSVLLGSSQILLLKKIRETLAGRLTIYELYPLSMQELYAQNQEDLADPPLLGKLLNTKDIDSILKNIPVILFADDKNAFHQKQAQDHILTWGGMPALLHIEQETERRKWLKDYEYTYLERDLSDLARLQDLLPFRTLQKLAALRSSQLLHYSELARDSAVSVDTARRYIEYLRLSYQVTLLQPYFYNQTKPLVKTPKLYWLDIGILRQLTGQLREVTGAIYETMAVSEFIKWVKTTQNNTELFFYRTKHGLEIDIIAKTQYGVIGFEIKNRNNVTAKDYKALQKFAEGNKKQWLGGIVIYTGDTISKIAEPNIWQIPAWRLFT